MASYYAIVVLSVLVFSISGGHALDEQELKTTLYIKQTYAQDQRYVGTDTVDVIINWVIKDGPDAAANTIGHAEGLTTHANPAKNFWVTIIDMVFEGGSLAGSTLQVMGLHGAMKDGQGQWSVMGGTGELTMARGIINYKIIQEDGASRTFEISICVYYTSKYTIPLLGGIGLFP
ncbi:uncharacterized protein LOC120679669 [Panicum virgatum]|uniref:Dirigent protein n=1 Tax=Panicum virgatum TaxID=38727 RepID=A0A8T0QWM3_PANVG|nr:uncharacterized protein LOC120679669 [Panicum virgatum]KAG2577601.1 hypothetical protein PVAP13_6NG193300 [Panicum virgatum]